MGSARLTTMRTTVLFAVCISVDLASAFWHPMILKNFVNRGVPVHAVSFNSNRFTFGCSLAQRGRSAETITSKPLHRHPIDRIVSIVPKIWKVSVFSKLLLLLRDVYGQFLVLFMDTLINRSKYSKMFYKLVSGGSENYSVVQAFLTHSQSC